MKLFNPESTHWYKPDGEAMHSVLLADGEVRPTTVCDARELGLLPSVTNILGVIHKPELVEWKMTQAVLAALTLPRWEGEGEDEFVRRVVVDAQMRVKTAMDFGSAFHAGAEQVAKTLEVDPAGPLAPWLGRHREWFQANCVRLLWTERVLVNRALGYAGTADLLIEHQQYGLTLVDYKTQGMRGEAVGDAERGRHGDAERDGGKKGYRAYGSWCQQLAAYRRAIGKPMVCLNLVVNSAEPGPVVEHVWSEEELQKGLESFEAALVIWRNEKGYDPRAAKDAETRGRGDDAGAGGHECGRGNRREDRATRKRGRGAMKSECHARMNTARKVRNPKGEGRKKLEGRNPSRMLRRWRKPLKPVRITPILPISYFSAGHSPRLLQERLNEAVWGRRVVTFQKPQRGGLFVDGPAYSQFVFCFSAARTERTIECPAEWRAAEKQKTKIERARWYYKQATPLGFRRVCHQQALCGLGAVAGKRHLSAGPRFYNTPSVNNTAEPLWTRAN